jgi:hypothetical protein
MTREDPQMKLRLPPELKDRLSEAAASDNRSLNAEVVSRLQESFSLSHVGSKVVKVDEAVMRAVTDRQLAALDERDKRRKKT